MRHVNSVALSGSDTTSQTGIQLDTNQIVACSFQASFGDSTAAGTVQVQMSNDITRDSYQPNDFTVVHWTNLPSGSASVTAGASVVVVIPQLCARWLRVIYTSTTPGTSTITVTYNGLSI